MDCNECRREVNGVQLHVVYRPELYERESRSRIRVVECRTLSIFYSSAIEYLRSVVYIKRRAWLRLCSHNCRAGQYVVFGFLHYCRGNPAGPLLTIPVGGTGRIRRQLPGRTSGGNNYSVASGKHRSINSDPVELVVHHPARQLK